MVATLIEVKTKLRKYEEDLVDISMSLIVEKPDDWINNVKVSYDHKSAELEYLLAYYHQKNNVTKWKYIRSIQNKLNLK